MVVRDLEGRTGGVTIATHRKNRRDRVGAHRFMQQHHAAAKGMTIGERVTGVNLQAGGLELARHVARHAVEIKIADRIGSEMHLAVAADEGSLIVQAADRFLITDDAEIVLLMLVLVQVARIEVSRHPLRAIRGGAGVQARGVGNLEFAVGGAQHYREAALIVKKAGEIGEQFALIGRVVDGLGAVRRVLDAEIVVIVAAIDEVAHLARHPAGGERRADSAKAAAIQGETAALVVGADIRVDVHDARRAEAVLCR